MRTIITTVGTSLLTNKDNRPWAGWHSGQPLPDKNLIIEWLTAADPVRASAEIHTWYRLGILEYPDEWQIRLVHSQTPDGSFCAQCLDQFAGDKGISSRTIQVNELNYADSVTFNRGLGRLVRVLAVEIRSGREKGEVAIAATGGFKAEIAVANLVGALLGVPVYYIYEQFEQLIRIEPIPISLEASWLKEGPGRSLLEKIGDKSCLPMEEISNFIKADSRLEMLVEVEDLEGRGYACANVLGELAAQLMASSYEDWPEPCEGEPESKIHLSNTEHSRPRNTEDILKRLASNIYVRNIRYDKDAGRPKNDLRPAADNESDILVSIFDGTKPPLGLRVQTTAKTQKQRNLVLGLLRKKINF